LEIILEFLALIAYVKKIERGGGGIVDIEWVI